MWGPNRSVLRIYVLISCKIHDHLQWDLEKIIELHDLHNFNMRLFRIIAVLQNVTVVSRFQGYY